MDCWVLSTTRTTRCRTRTTDKISPNPTKEFACQEVGKKADRILYASQTVSFASLALRDKDDPEVKRTRELLRRSQSAKQDQGGESLETNISVLPSLLVLSSDKIDEPKQ